jgi:hypothetical protein
MDVKQTLELIGDKDIVTNVLNEIKSEKRLIDFNKIEPTPEDLLITPHIDVIVAFQRYENPPEHLTDEQTIQFNQMKSNLIEYGHTDWREWRAVNWGYIENVQHTKMGKNDSTIEFTTPNVPAIIIVNSLSIKYPLIKFKFSYSNNTFTFKNGKVISTKK